MARREPHSVILEAGTRALAEMTKRLAEARADAVQALAWHGQERMGARQATFGATEFRAKLFKMPPHASPGAIGAFGQPQNEIGMLRRRPFRSFRRCRRTRIRDEVDQGPVGFVPDR